MNRQQVNQKYKVYQFDDGGSIWRVVVPTIIENGVRKYLSGKIVSQDEVQFHFLVYGMGTVHYFKPKKLCLLDTVLLSIVEHNSLTRLYRTNAPNDSMEPASVLYSGIEKEALPYLVSFFGDIGLPWLHKQLPHAIQIGLGLMDTLSRVAVNSTSLSEFAALELLVKELMAIGVEARMDRGFYRPHFVRVTLDADPKRDISLEFYRSIEFFDDDDQEQIHRDPVPGTFDAQKWTVGLKSHGSTLSSHHGMTTPLEDLVAEALKDNHLFLVSSSEEMDAFWTEYSRPGHLTFDASIFDLLGTDNPVTFSDDEFAAWADITGLEARLIGEMP